MLISDARVYGQDFRFHMANVRILGDTISDVSESPLAPASGEKMIDAHGLTLIPGLTDIHFHGCVGVDTNDATDETYRKMSAYQRSEGVTQICPATMTLPEERLEHIVKAAASYRRTQKASGSDWKDEASLVGVNLEGPFISPDKVGAQNPDFVHRPDADWLEKLLGETDSFPKLITVAPEVDGALDFIRRMAGRIRISVGHTSSDYEAAAAGFEAGAKHLTHLYNAMNGIHHRKPGPILAAFDAGDVTPELICDGIHVHPAAVRAAFRLFGPERMILISDSTRAVGMPDGEYEMGGQNIYKHDHAAYLADGTLAGSATNVREMMTNAIRFGIPEEDAVRAAAYNPVAAIGMTDKYGSIAPGKKARVLLVDPAKEYKLVRVITGEE
jgi:N-acetylglucosamine-6-phosphate deacetylase